MKLSLGFQQWFARTCSPAACALRARARAAPETTPELAGTLPTALVRPALTHLPPIHVAGVRSKAHWGHMMGRKKSNRAPDQAGTASSASMSSSSSPSMPLPRCLASSPSQSNCATPGAVLAGAPGGAGVHGPRPECSRTEEETSLGAAIPSTSAEPLPPGWSRTNVTTGLMQYSDGVDKAFTVKAAWELYEARRAGRGLGASGDDGRL